MRRKRKVFIVWMHDPLSKVVVPILDLELKRRGLDVVVDTVLKTSNMASEPQWMANNIENRVVICVVTPELAKWFNPGPDASPRKHLGARWEIRQLFQRLYEHGSLEGCPVIPVTPLGVSPEDGPMILRALENSRFDHVTGEGIDSIVKRVHNAYEHLDGTVSGQALPEVKQEGSNQAKDDLTESLRHVDASLKHANDLSKAWVKRALDKGVSHSSDLVQIFKKIVQVAHYSGDLALLRKITDICLEVVEQLVFDDEIRTEKSTYLLLGRTFLLCCDHKMEEAQKVAEYALALATDAQDATLVAKAERCLARIHCHFIDFTTGQERTANLVKARGYAETALSHFRSVDSADLHLAVFALAEIRLAEFRHLRNTWSRKEAVRLSAEAAAKFTDKRRYEYYDARLLRAAVAFESGDNDATSQVLEETLRDLRSRVEDAEAFTELLGKGHLLRARLWVARRHPDAQAEIGSARAIFDKLGLERMVAECDWLTFKCNRKRHGFAAYDIRTLERLCADPVTRLEVARRGRRWPATQELTGRFRGTNWKRAIQEVEDERRR